jgi:hypothetical protein
MSSTHYRGSIIDVVITRDDLPAPSINVVDVGLSDHRMLLWRTAFGRSHPVYTPVTRRSRRRLEPDVFRATLQSSPLCVVDEWPTLGVEQLARLYDDQITQVLDRLIPVQTVTCRRRPSDPWFDEECRSMKRSVRQHERAARRIYVVKSESFWFEKVDSERSAPVQLWRSVDALMGRGRLPMFDAIGPNELYSFFDAKVVAVQAAAADAPSASFKLSPPGYEFSEFRRVTAVDVIAAVRAFPDKQCSSDDAASEGEYRRAGAVCRRDVELLVVVRFCSICIQRRLHNNAAQEGQLGSGRRAVLPTDFQFIGHVEAARAAGG